MSESHLEDNYLPCERYQVHLPGEDGFARWQDPDNGQWYFAYYALDEVVLRSEGYVSEAGRDNGIESVKRYKDDDANYRAALQPGGKWVLELIAGNLKEIARSCQYDTEAEARMRMPGSIAARAAMAAPHATHGREDDYLACKDYEGHSRRSDHRHFSTFEKDGEYYFAYIADDGEVLLRSEGYQSYEARDNGIQSVIKNVHDEDRYKVIEKMGYYFVVLTAANHKEIARSCNLGQAAALALIKRLVGGAVVAAPLAAAATAAAAAAVPLAAAAPPPPVEESKGGMGWLWWLLPLLLLGLLYLLWKGCNKEETPAPAEPVATEPAYHEPVYASQDMCGWHPILFDFDKDMVQDTERVDVQKVVDILKANPSYRALFVGFTDSVGSIAYNQDLALRRATNARNAAIELGADGTRISTDEKDVHNPTATNRDALGRMYNRRVVMYVLDANNQLVCKQVEFDIPVAEQPKPGEAK